MVENAVQFPLLKDILADPMPFSTVWLVRGASGIGKTVFAFNFLNQGLRRDESAIYLSCDETPDMLRANFKKLGLATETYERMGKLIMIDAFSSRSNERYHIFDSSDPRLFLHFIGKCIKDVEKPCRVVVDSLTSINALLGEKRFFSFVQEKNRTLRQKDVVMLDLILAQDMESPEMYRLANTYDLILDLFWGEEKGAIRQRMFRINKARGTSYDSRPFPYKIVEKEGIVIDKNYYKEMVLY